MLAGFLFGLVVVASLAGTVGACLVEERRERADREHEHLRIRIPRARGRGFGGSRKSKEPDMAIDPKRRPFAFTMRWGLMALAAIALIVVVVVAIVFAV